MSIFRKKDKKQGVDSICIVLYTFSYDRSLTNQLFNFLDNYFQVKLSVDFKFLGFYDESYKDKYGKIESIKPYLLKAKWSNIVNISLDDEDIRGANRKVGIEFNITRPIQITMLLSNEFNFNLEDFLLNVSPLFRVEYGFSYPVTIDQWATAYANGDWQHTKKMHDRTRISKEVLQNWQKNCEKIQDGFFRDIYSENIITRKHLRRMLNEITFEEYIKSEKFGQLVSINDETYLLNIEQENLERARKSLYKTDLVI